METPKDRGTKVCSNGLGHMTKMAATPIYGKNPLKIFFSRTRRPMTLGLDKHLGHGAYQVCSNDDPRLTLTYLTSRSNLLPNAFKWDNVSIVDFFENCGSFSHYSHLICLT